MSFCLIRSIWGFFFHSNFISTGFRLFAWNVYFSYTNGNYVLCTSSITSIQMGDLIGDCVQHTSIHILIRKMNMTCIPITLHCLHDTNHLSALSFYIESTIMDHIEFIFSNDRPIFSKLSIFMWPFDFKLALSFSPSLSLSHSLAQRYTGN